MATQRIPLDQIVDNPFQPRTAFDSAALQSLADEMKASGFWAGALQGRRTKNGKIELVFGHRRLRALKLLKTEAVAVEIVDLTDAQMALRGLEENLQREGLTDLEKADAVKHAVELARADLRAAGKSEAHAEKEVAHRLGLGQQWVKKLCQISTSMGVENRREISGGHLTAKTAHAAKEWGGNAYVKTLASQGKAAATTGEVAKPTHMTVAAMRKVVSAAPEPVRERLKAAIVQGDVTTPGEAEQKGRRLAAERRKRNTRPPDDLKTVIVDWTHRIEDWTKQFKDVIPYMDYVEEAPAIAKGFRRALRDFIAIAETVLEEKRPEPKVVKGSVVR